MRALSSYSVQWQHPAKALGPERENIMLYRCIFVGQSCATIEGVFVVAL